jgi:MFS transporter, PPP family, 3-phenylpropionic acid transporter
VTPAAREERTQSGFAWRLSAFYAAVFLVAGTKLPFLPVWLEWRGLTLGEISIVAAVPLFARIIVTPAIALASDRWGEHRSTLVILAWIALAGVVLLTQAHGFPAILALTLLIAVAWTTIMPLAETVAMGGVRAQGLDYGRMRLWGSLSFIAASFAGGWAIVAAGPGAAVWLMAVGAAGTLAAAYVLPSARSPGPAVTARPSVTRADIVALVMSGRFVVFLLAVGLTQAAHAVFYTFGTVHWKAQGISAGWAGVLWAVGVGVEIGLFAFSGTVVRTCGAAMLIAAGAFAGVVRWSAMAADPPLAALVMLQALHGLTYGATHIGAVHYITASVPPALAGTAQALYASVTAGIAMGLATLLAGQLYEASGGLAYLAMAGLSLVGLLAGLVLLRKSR